MSPSNKRRTFDCLAWGFQIRVWYSISIIKYEYVLCVAALLPVGLIYTLLYYLFFFLLLKMSWKNQCYWTSNSILWNTVTDTHSTKYLILWPIYGCLHQNDPIITLVNPSFLRRNLTSIASREVNICLPEIPVRLTLPLPGLLYNGKELEPKSSYTYIYILIHRYIDIPI